MSENQKVTVSPRLMVEDLVWHTRRRTFGNVIKIWRKVVEEPRFTYTYYDMYTVKFEDNYRTEKVDEGEIQFVDRQEPFEPSVKESAVEPDLGN